jgi:hypothetical protein
MPDGDGCGTRRVVGCGVEWSGVEWGGVAWSVAILGRGPHHVASNEQQSDDVVLVTNVSTDFLHFVVM